VVAVIEQVLPLGFRRLRMRNLYSVRTPCGDLAVTGSDAERKRDGSRQNQCTLMKTNSCGPSPQAGHLPAIGKNCVHCAGSVPELSEAG